MHLHRWLRTIETGLEPQAVTGETFDAALDTWVSYLIIREERTEMKDYVLGTFEDEEGFPHVAMYRVRREP